MQFKVMSLFCLCLLMVGWFAATPAAAQSLPASNWYVVVHTQLSDQLVWMNAQGVQATIPRPHLPDEQQGPKGTQDLRISPNGRYAVVSATLTNGLTGLGIYDFQQGSFVKVHTAQPGEIVVLGSRQSFMPDSSSVAVSFYTLGNQGAVSDWRIIQFELATGNPIGSLKRSENKFQEPNVGAGSYPYVYYAPGKAQVFAFRFTMIPYAVGGQTELSAFAWAPAGNAVVSQGMLSESYDILPSTDAILESRYEVALPSVQLDGPIPIYNVVTQRLGLDQPPATLIHNGTASLFSPRWAKNGTWVAFQATSNTESHWEILDVNGSTSFAYTQLSPSEIYGTTEGVLLNYDNASFMASSSMDASAQPVLYKAPQGDEARVVYVTPLGGAFTLGAFGNGSQPQLETNASCAGAPVSQVGVGMPVRVTFTDGTALRVRQEPGGTIITELAEGTQFTLTDGPVCSGGYLWWKMSMPISGGTLIGWVAEGSLNGYFIEPYYTDGNSGGVTIGTPFSGIAATLNAPPVFNVTLPPAAVITLPPAVAVTPTLIMINPNLVVTPPPVIINTNFITDGDCSAAVAQFFKVGDTVITQGSGTLSVRDTPTATIPTGQIASGVSGTVQDGPLCHKGFRLWKIAFSTGVTGWSPDSYRGNVYLKKS